jgi:hypothetical protein
LHRENLNNLYTMTQIIIAIVYLIILEWVDGLRAVVENLSIQERSHLPPRDNLAAYDCLQTCRKQLHETEMCNAKLVQIIESCKDPIPHNDPDLLTLKALTSATISTLNAAYSNIQKCQYQEVSSSRSPNIE